MYDLECVYIRIYIYSESLYIGTKDVASYESKLQSFSTIRHINCEVLLSSSVPTKYCAVCTKYRKSLNAMLSRHHQQLKPSPNTKTISTSISSHTNYRYLSSDDKTIKIHALYNALTASKQQKHRLKEIIDASKSVTISKELNDSLVDTMNNYSKEINKDYPEQTFPHLFWQQQMQAASVKDSRAMKWHPLMIKWCLYLQHKSSGGYELVRDSGQFKFNPNSIQVMLVTIKGILKLVSEVSW